MSRAFDLVEWGVLVVLNFVLIAGFSVAMDSLLHGTVMVRIIPGILVLMAMVAATYQAYTGMHKPLFYWYYTRNVEVDTHA